MKYLILHIEDNKFNPLFNCFLRNWSKGKNVTHFNISSVLGFNSKKKFYNFVKIDSLQSLREILVNFDAVVPLFYFSRKFFKVYELLFNSKIKIVGFFIGTNPGNVNKVPIYLSFIAVKNILLKLYIFIKFYRLYVYDQIYTCGFFPLKYNKFIYKYNKIAKPNPYYALSKEMINKQNISYPKRYIVYVDINITQHPDIIFSDTNEFYPKEYYKKIIDFLINIEKLFKCKVIVASHPTRIKNFSKKFTFVKDDTGNLIKNSMLVLTHNSTANFFSFIYKKPCIFLIDNIIINNKKSPTKIAMLNYQSYTKTKLLNIDNYKIDKLSKYICNTAKSEFIKDFINFENF